MYQLLAPQHHFTFTRASISLFAALIVWEVVWKGIALWKAGRNNQPIWFIVILLVNAAGIVEIIYLLFFQVRNTDTPSSKNSR